VHNKNRTNPLYNWKLERADWAFHLKSEIGTRQWWS